MDHLPLAHVSKLRARWGDMDAFGHVNNTKYLTYCEQARIEWMMAASFPISLTGGEQGPIMVTAELVYHKPMVAPCEVEVQLFAGDPGRSSFHTHHKIQSDDVLYCSCDVKLVWVNYAAGKSVPLPKDIRAYLEGLVDR